MNIYMLMAGTWMLIFFISFGLMPSREEYMSKRPNKNVPESLFFNVILSFALFISTMLTFLIFGFII